MSPITPPPNVSSVADYFIICSGRSDTQVQAIADGVEAHLVHRARLEARDPVASVLVGLGLMLLCTFALFALVSPSVNPYFGIVGYVVLVAIMLFAALGALQQQIRNDPFIEQAARREWACPGRTFPAGAPSGWASNGAPTAWCLI